MNSKCATAIGASDASTDGMPPLIFKLNVDCFEKVFEWLSLGDLRALRQTCKRMKLVVDYYIELNYPLVFRKLPIRDYHLEYHRRAEPSAFKLVNHIDLLTSTLSSPQIEDIKHILNRVESINIESLQIEGDFFDMFLRFCPRLKCLSISKIRTERIIGSENDWLHRKYPTIEHIMLHTFNFHLNAETVELKTFFEQNPQIHTFSTTFEFLWMNAHWLLESNIHLDLLDISGACNTVLPTNDIWTLLQKLHKLEFYKRLNVTASWIESQDDIDQIASLHALEKLCLKSISIKIVLPPIKSLKVLAFHAYEYFVDLDVWNSINLEQIYISYASIDDILPFIRNCVKLKQIIVNHLESGKHFKNGIINVLALNEERKKLANACKIRFYVNEKIFLTQKWTSTVNDKLIELERIQSCKRDQPIW